MCRIDELFLRYPFYGSRQMKHGLRGEGVSVGRHRVRRLMRLMGLEAIYQAPRTSEPHPAHRIYPYLLRDVAVERPDHVCAPTSPTSRYGGFLYLVAFMDWATRHVLAWRLSNTMDAGFCIEALRAALARYGKPAISTTPSGCTPLLTVGRPRKPFDRAACGHDGQGSRLAHIPTGPPTPKGDQRESGFGSVISVGNTP